LRKVTIIGGGISGLTCGWHLANSGYKVTVLEREPIPGGLARSFFVEGKWVPLTYHHVLSPDTFTQEYIKKFALSKELRWVSSSQVFWYDNKAYLLSKPHHIFRFKPINFFDRLRLLYLGGFVYFKKDWDDLIELDCYAWLHKMVGRQTTRLLFQSLMDIKFNMPLSSVSAAWLGRRMHQSVRNHDRYGYIRGGWQELINRMAGGIIEKKGEVICDFEVTGIGCGNAIEGRKKDGSTISLPCETVVSTVPPALLKNILRLPEAGHASLDAVAYKGLISFVCASKKKISRHYWSVVLKPHLIFGGFFNHTVLSPSVDNGAENIYYFFAYLEHDDPFFDHTEERIKDMFLDDIRKLFPDFEIDWYRIFKIRFAQPVFTRGYVNPPVELGENLYLAGVYRQFPRPRTMDAAFRSGLETAQYIMNKHGAN